MKTKEAKNLINFLELTFNLEPIEFAGVLRIFGVSLVDKDKKPLKFEELLSETIDCFCALGTKQQKQLLEVVRAAAKKGKKNGN